MSGKARPIEYGGVVYLSARAMAKAVGVSPATVNRWVHRGKARYVDGEGVRSATPRKWRRLADKMTRAGKHAQAEAALLFAESWEWL